MPKVSEEHKEQVRRRLLDAAWRVVGRDGVEATTTRAILDEADMSAGALYSYFRSKDELLKVLAAEKITETLTLVAAQGEPYEGERELLMRYSARLLTQPSTTMALAAFRGRMTSDPAVNDAVHDVNRSIVDRFAPLVESAQRQRGGIGPTHDAEALVELVDLIVDGLNRRHLTGTLVTSFERVGEVAMAIFLGAIEPGDVTGSQGERDT